MKQIFCTFFFLALLFVPQRFSLAEGNLDSECLIADIVLLVDRSSSQTDFQDEMLYAIQNILFQLPINSKQVRVGIISFADSATVQSWITGDRDHLTMLLDSLYEIPIQPSGTYIEQGVSMTPSLFLHSAQSRKHDVYKAIIILSDGEIGRWEYSLSLLRYLERKYSVNVYSLGIGSDDMSDYVLRRMATDTSYFGGNDIERIIGKIKELDMCL